MREIVHDARLRGLLFRHNNREQLTSDVMRRIYKVESLSAYFDCCIEMPIPSDSGMVYQVKLNSDRTRSINWDVSKKLLFGSLVCMSNDFFDKMCLIGSICERNTDRLKDGFILVKFNIDLENRWNDEQVTTGSNFILLETSAHFESYKYVLESLVAFQRDSEKNFPFKESLVYGQNRVIPMPRYLTNAPIDFRLLFVFIFYTNISI